MRELDKRRKKEEEEIIIGSTHGTLVVCQGQGALPWFAQGG